MGDVRATIGGASPGDRWSSMAAPQRPAPRHAESYEEDRTRIDLPIMPPAGDADHPDASASALPHAAPPQAPANPQAQWTHAPWTVASSWGATSLNTPNTLAGLSYLFWWVSGLFVYFNERNNRFVRFHAVQSILLTGALTVASVALYILWELSADLAAATRQPAFAHVGQGIALLGFLGVVGLWVGPMFAAWSGHHLRLPIVGAYAERYAAPPREPFPPSPFAD